MSGVLRSLGLLMIGISVAGPARADEAAQAVIDKAIKAHGGAEILEKQKDKAVIQKGKIHVSTMGLDIEGTMEVSVSGVAGGEWKFKQDLQISVMGTDINQVVGFDGKELWIAANGKVVMTIDKKEDIEKIKEAAFAEEAAGLVLLKDKSIEVSIIGEDKVDETPVIGVRVSKKGRQDVSLYFEKESGLLKKVHSRSVDFMSGQEVEQTRILSEYKEHEGQMRPMRVEVRTGDRATVKVEITETQLLDKIDDAVFAKPAE